MRTHIDVSHFLQLRVRNLLTDQPSTFNLPEEEAPEAHSLESILDISRARQVPRDVMASRFQVLPLKLPRAAPEETKSHWRSCPPSSSSCREIQRVWVCPSSF